MGSNTKNCTKCGMPNWKEAQFCAECGSPFPTDKDALIKKHVIKEV